MEVGVCILCLVTSLWIPVYCDDSNNGNHDNIQIQGDSPRNRGQDQCGMISHIQSAVIQILNNHYEYGKGIHKLHGLVDHVQEDMVSLKSKLSHMDRWQKTMLTNQIPADEAAEDRPHQDEDTQDYNKYIQETFNKKGLVPSVKSANAVEIPKGVQDVLANLSALVESEGERLNSLERKYKSLRRSIKQTLDNMVKSSANVQAPDTKGTVGHFMGKQKEINTHLEKRILELENDWKQWQADTPAAGSDSPACPPNFVRHLSSCYRFCNITANWVDAEKHCQQLHPKSHLVAIETKEEEDFLVLYRHHNGAWWTSHYLWAGATDMAEEGQWRWVGTGAPLVYTNWRNGQPNNQNQNQHCVYFFAGNHHDHHWDDWHCRSANLNFVCEVPVQVDH